METASTSTIDIIVFAILGLSGLLALVRGFVRELVGLGVWLGSIIISALLLPVAKPFAAEHIRSEMGADAAAALALFCASLIVLIPIGNLIAGLVRGDTLTAIDRSLGFVFGLVRGVLVVCLLYLGASFLWPDEKQPVWLQEAKTRPLMAAGADIIRSMVPDSDVQKATQDVENTRSKLDEAAQNINQLNRLSTIVPEAPKTDETATTGYGEESRSKLEELIKEKAQ